MADRMQAEIEGQVRATPRDIADHFDAIPTDSLPLIPEEIRYSRLMIEPELSESEKLETRMKLDSIRSEVVAGQARALTLAAMRHSEDPGSKYKGGCYEDIRRGAFVPGSGGARSSPRQKARSARSLKAISASIS